MCSSTYTDKKALKATGSRYRKIHGCVNNFILYMNEYEGTTICPTCGKSRWKVDGKKHVYPGVLHHPVDSLAWFATDDIFPDFAIEIRNMRLGISADGVDLHGGNKSYNVCHVLSVIYNFPPWICMKKKVYHAFVTNIGNFGKLY
uniref:Transposase-associated domain-containing protein n=1 Tax=Lactuca sativa TaxID=4236 RepID=A0A9R1V432_LACSA|nr:hypothetical protein LSAT_V11C700349340 [Lactuca sativa]